MKLILFKENIREMSSVMTITDSIELKMASFCSNTIESKMTSKLRSLYVQQKFFRFHLHTSKRANR